MHGYDHRPISEETGLDSWFLHEKLVLSLLSARDAIELTRRILGPEHPLAQVMRVELFERALAAYLAQRVDSRESSTSEGDSSKGQLVWLEQAITFKGVGVALE